MLAHMPAGHGDAQAPRALPPHARCATPSKATNTGPHAEATHRPHPTSSTRRPPARPGACTPPRTAACGDAQQAQDPAYPPTSRTRQRFPSARLRLPPENRWRHRSTASPTSRHQSDLAPVLIRNLAINVSHELGREGSRPKRGKARWGQLTRSHGGHPGCAADREPFEPPTDTRSVMRATVGVSVGRVAV